MRRLFPLLLTLLLAGSLSGCGGEAAEVQTFAMDTVMTFTAYGNRGEAAVKAAEEEVFRLEDLLSRTRTDSQVSRLNDAGGAAVAVGEEVCGLLASAEKYAGATGGAFDVTVAPVVAAWGFTTDHYQVPDPAELTELLDHVGPGQLTLTADTAALAPGAQIDLGGIAKGYASDQVADLFAQYDVRRGKVSLGGNVYVRGSKPDGSPWRVGVQDPVRADAYVGVLSLEDAFAVTSGGYQRYFEQDGQVYHHIIDPATGYPAESGLVSVTVVADGAGSGGGTMCDAFSTALFVLGEEKALDFWRSGGYDFDLVLVTDDGRVVSTAGLADRFQPSDGSGYVYETVS